VSDNAKDKTLEFERAVKAAKETAQKKYVLRLYVAGASSRSQRAIENLKKVCEEHLKGQYDLEVIDIYQQPSLAEGEQIVAVPTLIKKLPTPLRKFIGDMSNTERILFGLDLKPREATRRGKKA